MVISALMYLINAQFITDLKESLYNCPEKKMLVMYPAWIFRMTGNCVVPIFPSCLFIYTSHGCEVEIKALPKHFDRSFGCVNSIAEWIFFFLICVLCLIFLHFSCSK